MMPKAPERIPGLGSDGPVAGFIRSQDAAVHAMRGDAPAGGGAWPRRCRPRARSGREQNQLRPPAFIAKYPPTSPMIVGGIEEVRIDDKAHELYAADNFSADASWCLTWTRSSSNADGAPTATSCRKSPPTTKTASTRRTAQCPRSSAATSLSTFRTTDLVYAADRMANRIDVTDKQGNFKKEFIMAAVDRRWRFHRRRDVLSRQRGRNSCLFPISPTTTSGSSTATTARSWARWEAWGKTPASSSACTWRPWTRRACSTPGRYSPASECSASCCRSSVLTLQSNKAFRQVAGRLFLFNEVCIRLPARRRSRPAAQSNISCAAFPRARPAPVR